MRYPKQYDDEFLNIVKQLIDLAEQTGRSVQDLVAEGQLTEEQYAELLTTINGLVKSGNVDESDLTPEFKQKIEGFSAQLAQKPDKTEVETAIGKIADGTPEFANDITGMTNTTKLYVNLTDGYLYRNNGTSWVSTGVLYQEKGIANRSVSEEKTTFMERSPNLHDGSYRVGFVGTNGAYRGDSAGDGRLTMIEVKPNTSYYVKVFREDSADNRFAITQLSGEPIFVDDVYRSDRVISLVVYRGVTDESLNEYEFTTASNAKYILVYVSPLNHEPNLMVTESVNKTEDYMPMYYIPADYNYPIVDMIEDLKRDIGSGGTGGSGVETYNQVIVRKSSTNFTDSLLILNKTKPFIIDTLQFGWGGANTENGLQLKISVGSESILEPSNGTTFFPNTANNIKLYDNPYIDILTYDITKNVYLFSLNVNALRFEQVKIELIKVNSYAGNPTYTVELIGRDVIV